MTDPHGTAETHPGCRRTSFGWALEDVVSGKPWFRLYAEFVSDPKVQLLAFEDQRHFVALLCLKCNGTLDTDAVSVDHRERMIARALGLDPASAAEAKRRLKEIALIDDHWQPVRWSTRQYESDSSTQRVHKFREKQRETLPKRFRNVQEQSRTDTEQTRAEQKAAVSPSPAGLDLEAWKIWKAYRKEIKKPIREGSMKAAMEAMAALGSNQRIAVDHTMANGWQGLREPERKRGFGDANYVPAKTADQLEAETNG